MLYSEFSGSATRGALAATTLAGLALAIGCPEAPTTGDAGGPSGDAHALDADSSGNTDAGADTDVRPVADGATDVDAGAADGGSGDARRPDAGPRVVDECVDPDPAWVFCSGFEEGDKSIWDDYDGNPDETNLLLADTGPFNLAGNTVMRLRVPPGRGGADLVKVLDSTHDRLYARWYVQWEPGYDFDAPNHGGGLHAGDRDRIGASDNRPVGDDWFTAWIEPVPDLHRLNVYSYYRGMYMNCADPQGSCWGDMFPCMVDEGEVFCEEPQHRETVLPPVVESGRWYCVEMLLDGGTPSTTGDGADGVIDFWVDGLEIGPWDDLWLRTTADLKLTVLWLSLFHHGEHSVEGLMLDNAVVSTERIGCLD